MAAVFLGACSETPRSSSSSQRSTNANTNNSNNSNSNSNNFSIPLDLFPSNTTVTVNSSVIFTGTGGTPPYSYSVITGEGNIDPSSGAFSTGSNSGYSTIQISDSNGQTASYSIFVSEPASPTVVDGGSPISNLSNVSCLKLDTPQVSRYDNGIQRWLDATQHSVLDQHVIVGLGLRVYDENVAGIYTRMSKMDSNTGTIDNTTSYSHKVGDLNPTARGEVYVEVPDDYYIYGFGVALDNFAEDATLIKVWGAKIDQSGNVNGRVQCLVDNSGNSGCASVANVSSQYQSSFRYHSGNERMPIVGLGMGVVNNRVSAFWIKNMSITSYTTTGSCP